MAASNILKEDAVKHMFGITTWTPGTWYVALFKSATGLATGSASQEVQTSATLGYARQAFAATWAGSGDPGSVSNTGAHNFAASGGAWADVTHVALCESSTPGANDIGPWLALDEAIVNINDGSTVDFAIGDLVFEVA